MAASRARPAGSWAVLLLLVTLSGQAARAADARPAVPDDARPAAEAQAPAPGAWELVHRTAFDWRDRDQRRAIATDLRERVELLIAAVPPQSPRERARVLREVAELSELTPGEAPREQSSLFLSRPYQHYRLLEALHAIRAELDCVLAQAVVTSEMACWARVSAALLREEELQLGLAMLRTARMMPRDGNMPVLAQDPIVWYPEYGRGILVHIVAPYLDSVGLDAVGGAAGSAAEPVP